MKRELLHIQTFFSPDPVKCPPAGPRPPRGVTDQQLRENCRPAELTSAALGKDREGAVTASQVRDLHTLSWHIRPARSPAQPILCLPLALRHMAAARHTEQPGGNQQFIFATPFSVDVNLLPVNFPKKCTGLQSGIQLKNTTFTFISPLLREKNIPHPPSHLVHCFLPVREQPLSRRKHGSKTSSEI